MAGELPRASRRTLADKLNEFFAMLRPEPEEIGRGRPGREYYNSEIAERINRPGPTADRIRSVVGEPVTISAYLGELRQGKATDPRLSHLQTLAIAFGVPTSYLVDDDADPDHEVSRVLHRSGGIAAPRPARERRRPRGSPRTCSSCHAGKSMIKAR